MKFKKTLTAVGVAAIAGAGAMSVLPDAQAASPKSSQPEEQPGDHSVGGV